MEGEGPRVDANGVSILFIHSQLSSSLLWLLLNIEPEGSLRSPRLWPLHHAGRVNGADGIGPSGSESSPHCQIRTIHLLLYPCWIHMLRWEVWLWRVHTSPILSADLRRLYTGLSLWPRPTLAAVKGDVLLTWTYPHGRFEFCGRSWICRKFPFLHDSSKMSQIIWGLGKNINTMCFKKQNQQFFKSKKIQIIQRVTVQRKDGL